MYKKTISLYKDILNVEGNREINRGYISAYGM